MSVVYLKLRDVLERRFPQRKQPDEKQERERGRKVREEEQTVDSLACKASVRGRRAALFYNHLDAVRVEWRTRDALALIACPVPEYHVRADKPPVRDD